MTRVLLLEANMQRPSLASALGCPWSESLVANIVRTADVGPPYPVVSILETRLHVAVLPGTPLERGRLDRTLFAVALSDLRSAYDYIVVDAASVFESGDVDVVAENAGGVLLVARAGRSRRGEVRRAVAQLAPAKVLGSVLVDV